jgi:hypothetical protein
MDGDLFGGVDRFVAPIECKHINKRARNDYSLLTFVLVLTLEFLNTCKLSQRLVKCVTSPDIHAQVKKSVEGITVMAALAAVDP